MPRVVLAEDDATMVRLLSSLLRMDGYEVEALGRNEDVAVSVERLAPDALIMDVVLAGQNGLDLLKRIRGTATGAGLYIIMMSGLSAREECIRRGADDFLLKPFMPDELIGMLRTHVQAGP
jgi:DNA-binding response OmpR family regulator